MRHVVRFVFFVVPVLLFMGGCAVKQPEPTVAMQKIEYMGSDSVAVDIPPKPFEAGLEEDPSAAGEFIPTLSAEEAAAQIVEAAQKAKKGQRTLPMFASWNAGADQTFEGLDPDYMLSLVDEGYHALPAWHLDPYWADAMPLAYYETSIQRAAELGLPLVFVSDAWESALSLDGYFLTFSDLYNPNVITPEGDMLERLSPFGSTWLWNFAGMKWTGTELMEQLQAWYPDPPLVLFLSANDADRLDWSELALSSRYLLTYGEGQSDDEKRRVVADAWYERYKALEQGMRNALVQPAWKANAVFVGRNAFGTQEFGMRANWMEGTTYHDGTLSVWPLAFDGASVDFALDPANGIADEGENSPHVRANNLPMLKEEVELLNPDFWFENTLDGSGILDDAERYRGLAQFALWFNRPAILREAAVEHETRDATLAHFSELMDSVEMIHKSEILQDFWEHGELVKNPDGNHPYAQNIPEAYRDEARWYLLDTDPEDVWAFALVKGEAPEREWLVFVQSSRLWSEEVQVNLPDHNIMALEPSQKGNFYLLTQTSIQTTFNALALEASENQFMPPDSPSTIIGKGRSYYIDPISGKDKNDGTSTKTAWQSLSAIKNFDFNPGDAILLKRGSTFYEPLDIGSYLKGAETNPITIGAYGTGARPVISTLKNLSSTWYTSQTNIWETSVEYHPQRLLKNNIEILRANSNDEIDGKTFFWFSDGSSIYLFSKTDPNKDTFQISRSGKTINMFGTSYINLQDIELIGGFDASLAVNTCSHINLKNLKIGQYARNGIKISNSSNVSLSNSIIDATFALDYSNASIYNGTTDRGAFNGIYLTQSVRDSNISYNFIKNWNHANIDLYADISSSGNEIQNILINGNYLTSPDIPYGGRLGIDGNSHDNKVYNNTFYAISVRNQINGYNNHFYKNIINGVRKSPLKDQEVGNGIAIEGYAGNVHNNIIEQNIIANTESECIYIARMNKYSVHDNIFRKNLFLNCGTTISGLAVVIGRWDAGDGTTFNNVFDTNMIYSQKMASKNIIIQNGVSMDVPSFNGRFNNTASAHGNIYSAPAFTDSNKINFDFVQGSLVQTLFTE